MDKMSVNYEKAPVLWPNAELTFNKDSTIHLKLWEDGVDPEQLSETWERLKSKAESLRVALKYRGDHNIRLLNFGFSTYYFDDKKFILQNEKNITDTIDLLRHGKGQYKEPFGEPLPIFWDILNPPTTSSVSLPQTMPSIPPDLHRIAETLVAAEELGKYPDLVMKLAFLIIEEFNREKKLNKDELLLFQHVRDFVSHAKCDRKQKLIDFILRELPDAKMTDGVQFRRHDKNHMAFVAKYASQAVQRARELFNEKVRNAGGFIRD